MNRHVHPTGPACLAAGIALALLAGFGNAASPGPDAVTGPAAVTAASGVDGTAVDVAAAEEAEPAVASAIPGLREPRAGLYTAAQPEPEAWKVAARDGVTTVINLRPEGEMAGRDEAAEVAAAGLAYHHLPVAGAGDVNEANAEQLRQLIEQAPGPVLVHCASGQPGRRIAGPGCGEGRRYDHRTGDRVWP